MKGCGVWEKPEDGEEWTDGAALSSACREQAGQTV